LHGPRPFMQIKSCKKLWWLFMFINSPGQIAKRYSKLKYIPYTLPQTTPTSQSASCRTQHVSLLPECVNQMRCQSRPASSQTSQPSSTQYKASCLLTPATVTLHTSTSDVHQVISKDTPSQVLTIQLPEKLFKEAEESVKFICSWWDRGGEVRYAVTWGGKKWRISLSGIVFPHGPLVGLS
jgi:hypothetical protein